MAALISLCVMTATYPNVLLLEPRKAGCLEVARAARRVPCFVAKSVGQTTSTLSLQACADCKSQVSSKPRMARKFSLKRTVMQCNPIRRGQTCRQVQARFSLRPRMHATVGW